MLEIKDLRFAYEGQETPYCFDLIVEPGEITAISGTSGAGKSTFLDLIAGFAAPSGGSISCNNQEIAHLPPEQRPASILFQSDNLFEHLSVARNLSLGLPKTIAKSELERLIGDALEKVGLGGLESRRAANLSGGQKQRVALARTLLRNKPILLLDEPFSALDEDTVDTLRQLVRDLTHEHKWHVLIVSHNQNDIITLADTAYIIDDYKLTKRSPKEAD